jgi:hypothetical protein
LCQNRIPPLLVVLLFGRAMAALRSPISPPQGRKRSVVTSPGRS